MLKGLLSNTENKAGILITVIFHLTVIIVLLVYQIDATVRREESFVIDFSRQEEIERQIQEMEEMEREIEKMEAIRQRLEARISETSVPEVRNIAVDRSGFLKDDRGTDAEKLYKDAEKLANDLRNGQSNAIEEDARGETVDLGKGGSEPKPSGPVYSGPSVLSYTLDGRKASKLPIPAYRCYGGGQVTVIITVNPQGMVIDARVQEEISSSDQCLCKYAVRAARLSRFSQSSTAPSRQVGEIVYQFIAQ